MTDTYNRQLVLQRTPHPHPHAHLVHPSPVRAHSYPFATFSGYSSSAGTSGAGLYGSPNSHHPSLAWSRSSPSSQTVRSTHSQHSHASHATHTSHQPPPVHSHSLSASSLHHLPSPPLSTSTMPDPWGAERDDDDLHPWSNGGPPLPPVGLPPAKSHATVGPRSPKPNGHARPLSPMSKKLLAPVSLEVWAAVLDKSKGRDKILKTIQYSLRTYLYLLGLIAAVRPLGRFFSSSQQRSKVATAGLSLTRKCLLLFNPLRPAGALLSPEPTSARAFLNHLIDLVGAISDDIFCLSKLGLVSKRKGIVADRWANRVWFFNTIVGLYSSWLKSGTRRTESEKHADDIQTKKYLCDLAFVSYDIFGFTWAKEPVQCAAGLTAAIISTSQLYKKDYLALAKR